jgi:hypothetical protein
VAGGNYGVLDNKGFWILPPEYSDIKRLNDSIFSYRVAYEYDVYDDKGNKITEEKADALQYRNGILTLRQESKIGYYKPGSGMIWELQE